MLVSLCWLGVGVRVTNTLIRWVDGVWALAWTRGPMLVEDDFRENRERRCLNVASGESWIQ